MVLTESPGPEGLIYPTQARPVMKSHPWDSQPRPWIKPKLAVGPWLCGPESQYRGPGDPMVLILCPLSSNPCHALPLFCISEAWPLQATFPRLGSARFCVPGEECHIREEAAGCRPLCPCLEQPWPSSCSTGCHGHSCQSCPSSQAWWRFLISNLLHSSIWLLAPPIFV